MGINFAGRVFSQVIIKLTYHVKPRGVFSISSGTIRLIRANQEFDTGNICVGNWLTICNNLLMDHQQHYWYIKNSCRALQNTNNSIYLLNILLSLVGRRRGLLLVEGGAGRLGDQYCEGSQRNVFEFPVSSLHVKLIWRGGNHHPAGAEYSYNNSISREMRRKDGQPASSIE